MGAGDRRLENLQGEPGEVLDTETEIYRGILLHRSEDRPGLGAGIPHKQCGQNTKTQRLPGQFEIGRIQPEFHRQVHFGVFLLSVFNCSGKQVDFEPDAERGRETESSVSHKEEELCQRKDPGGDPEDQPDPD